MNQKPAGSHRPLAGFDVTAAASACEREGRDGGLSLDPQRPSMNRIIRFTTSPIVATKLARGIQIAGPRCGNVTLLDNSRLDLGNQIGRRNLTDRRLIRTGRTSRTTTSSTRRRRAAVTRTGTAANTTQRHEGTGKQIGNRRQHGNLLQKLRPQPRRTRSRPDHQKSSNTAEPNGGTRRIGQRTLVGRIVKRRRDERRSSHEHIHGRSSLLSQNLGNRRADDHARIRANKPERGTIGQRVPRGRTQMSQRW